MNTENVKYKLKCKLREYLNNNWGEIMNAAMQSIKHTSVVHDNYQQYTFVGNGCGIVVLKYRKGNKKAELVDTAVNELHDELYEKFVNSFTEEEQNKYKNCGCPLEAFWTQDLTTQRTFYYKVLEFANKMNINMSIWSNED